MPSSLQSVAKDGPAGSYSICLVLLGAVFLLGGIGILSQVDDSLDAHFEGQNR